MKYRKMIEKRLFAICIAALCMALPLNGNAQDLKDILSGIMSGATGSKTVTTAKNALGSLIGTKTVGQDQLTGTWSYSRPAIAFETTYLLNKIGGSVVSTKIENKIAAILSQYGIKAGILIFSFQKDGTFTSKLNQKTITGTYKLNKANITFTYANKRSITANIKQSGKTLQLTFTADKLLDFLKEVNSELAKETSNETLSTISSLLKAYKGMQLGLQFNKTK